MSCEAACKIILSSEDYGIADYGIAETEELQPPEFDAAAEIEKIYGILSNRDTAYHERLDKIFKLYDIPRHILENETDLREIFLSLEYLDDSHKEAFESYKYSNDTEKEKEKLLERALAYYIFRHAGAADSQTDFKARLTLSLLLERLYATQLSSTKETDFEAAVEAARVISEELEYSEDNLENLLFYIEFSL